MSIKLVSDTIGRGDIDALVRWLESEPIPKLTKGPLTLELEEKWSNYLGVKHTTFVNSGSSALLLMLATLQQTGRLRNKRIVVPGLSWVTDVSSCTALGYTPILCDCNFQDLSVDLNDLERLFRKYRPSAFILVHVLGLVPDMDRILQLCERYNVILLEDVCEAMGSQYKGKLLGTFGEMSVFSLYFGHHISTIEGGFVCTNNKKLHNLNLMMRSHGWDRDLDEESQLGLRSMHNIDSFNAQYTFYVPGFNLRSTDLQAFLGLRQIDKLDRIVQRRITNFNLYNQYLTSPNNKYVAREGAVVSNFAYPIINERRSSIAEDLIKHGVEVRPLIAGSMRSQPFWQDVESLDFGDLLHCSLIHKSGMYLPNHQDLTESEIRSIAEIVNRYD